MKHKKAPLDINDYYYHYEYYKQNNSPTNALYLQCLKSCLKIALEKEITSPQKEILLDHFYNEKSMTEIAKQRGVTVGVVSRQIKSGKEKLRSKLEYFEAIYKEVFKDFCNDF